MADGNPYKCDICSGEYATSEGAAACAKADVEEDSAADD